MNPDLLGMYELVLVRTDDGALIGGHYYSTEESAHVAGLSIRATDSMQCLIYGCKPVFTAYFVVEVSR